MLDQAENILAEIAGASNQFVSATVEQLTSEIKLLTKQAVVNFVEIGRRLIEVKKKTDFGEWSTWLENEVEFSQEQARKLMRLAEEYPNSNALWNLPLTKAFALLQLPPNERSDFVEQPHQLPSGEVKTVDEMTTRELERLLREKNEAETARLKAETELEVAERAKKEARDRVHEQAETIRNLEKKLEERPEKEVPKVPDDYKQLKSDNTRLSKAQQDLLQQVGDLKSKLTVAEGTAKAYQANSIDERMAVEVKVGVFRTTVAEFVGKVAPLAYLAKEYAHTSPDCQRKYEDTIDMLDKLVADLRDTMIRPKASSVIEAEVIS